MCVCVASRKGVLKLVFLGLCPGPLYYPESVYFMYALRHREGGQHRGRRRNKRGSSGHEGREGGKNGCKRGWC